MDMYIKLNIWRKYGTIKILGKLKGVSTMTDVKVAIATANPVKIEAIKKAFELYFNDIEVLPFEVKSGVPSQPINEDVYKGARNRIEEIKKVNNVEVDYIVSCEGGLINQYGYWFNVQVIMVEGKDGKDGVALSQGFQIPPKYVDEVINTSIAKVLDRIFEGKGGIRKLTRDKFTRGDLITDGTIMALTRVMNGEIW